MSTMKESIKQAGELMYHSGTPAKFGTGAMSISTEACHKQQAFIEKKFNLSHAEFSEAFAYAEKLERLEDEAEAAFNKSHPELNP